LITPQITQIFTRFEDKIEGERTNMPPEYIMKGGYEKGYEKLRGEYNIRQ